MASQTVAGADSLAHTKITFIVTTQDDAGIQRLRDLSTVNAHVAGYAYSRRRQTGHDDQQVPSKSKAPISPKNRNLHKQRCDRREIQQTSDPKDELIIAIGRQASRNDNGIDSALFDRPLLSDLDPFLRLPVDVSELEKTAVAFCKYQAHEIV